MAVAVDPRESHENVVLKGKKGDRVCVGVGVAG